MRMPASRYISAGMFVLLALLTATVGAQAQIRALTDADVEKVASLLAIEVQRQTAAMTMDDEYQAAVAGALADGQAVLAGKRDAFQTLQSYRESVAAPPNGVYSASCSKYLTEDSKGLAVWAVFGFGVPADELGSRALKGDSAAVMTIAQQNLSAVAVKRTEAGQRVEDLMVSVHRFYTAKGYKPPPRLGGRAFAWYLTVPGVGVQMYPVNPHHDAPPCAGLGNGPVLHMLASPERRSADAALDEVNNALDLFSVALERVGLSRDEYHELRALVVMAHDDAYATAPLEAAAGGDAMLLEYLKDSIAQRKKNAAVYRRHAVRMDPLIVATRVHIP